MTPITGSPFATGSTPRSVFVTGLTTLVSIAVTPANPSILLGTTQPFTATGTYSDSSTLNLASTVVWTSSRPTVATIGATGLATSVAQGSTTVQATSGAISGATTLTVIAPVLVSIAVTPANSSIPLGNTQQFTATGTYTDSTTQNLTSTAARSSSMAGVATINAAGLATTLTQGSMTAQAILGRSAAQRR